MKFSTKDSTSRAMRAVEPFDTCFSWHASSSNMFTLCSPDALGKIDRNRFGGTSRACNSKNDGNVSVTNALALYLSSSKEP
eukprot:scaffold295085_cov47-Attheya_sp.AAC.1